MATGFSIAGIVAVGKTLWTIMTRNRAVYSVKTDFVHAVPKGVAFQRLTGWSPPVAVPFSYAHRSFGCEVVRLDFRASFRHSGCYKGAGKYVADATVRVADHRIGMFQNVDVVVKADRWAYVGDAAQAVASISLMTDIKHRSGFRHYGKCPMLTLNGDGGSDLQW